MVDDHQWFVGIDWATRSHSVCLLDAGGRRVGEREFAHGGTGLTELRDWLLEKTKAASRQIAVAIETPHGPVVEMLLEHGFVVFAINPKQLDRFRDRLDRKSTRLNSSHVEISYAVFCLKKKKKKKHDINMSSNSYKTL